MDPYSEVGGVEHGRTTCVESCGVVWCIECIYFGHSKIFILNKGLRSLRIVNL